MRQSGRSTSYASASAGSGPSSHHHQSRLINIPHFTGLLPCPNGKGMYPYFVCAFPTYDPRKLPLKERVLNQPLLDPPLGFYRALIPHGYGSVQALSKWLNITIAEERVQWPKHIKMLERLHSMIGCTIDKIDSNTVWSVYQLGPGADPGFAHLALEQAYELVINCMQPRVYKDGFKKGKKMHHGFDDKQSVPIAPVATPVQIRKKPSPPHRSTQESMALSMIEQGTQSEAQAPMTSASTTNIATASATTASADTNGDRFVYDAAGYMIGVSTDQARDSPVAKNSLNDILPDSNVDQLQTKLIHMRAELENQISKKKHYKKNCLLLLQFMKKQSAYLTHYRGKVVLSDDDSDDSDDKKDDKA